MTLTRKFYSRFNEALKHMAFAHRWTPAYSRTAHATEAVTLRIEGVGGAVQILRMSATEAGEIGRALVRYADEDDAFRTGRL